MDPQWLVIFAKFNPNKLQTIYMNSHQQHTQTLSSAASYPTRPPIPPPQSRPSSTLVFKSPQLHSMRTTKQLKQRVLGLQNNHKIQNQNNQSNTSFAKYYKSVSKDKTEASTTMTLRRGQSPVNKLKKSKGFHKSVSRIKSHISMKFPLTDRNSPINRLNKSKQNSSPRNKNNYQSYEQHLRDRIEKNSEKRSPINRLIQEIGDESHICNESPIGKLKRMIQPINP